MFEQEFISTIAEALATKVAERLLPFLDRPKVVPEYVTLKEAAVMLSNTEKGVERMIDRGRFKVSYIGAKRYISVQHIRDVMHQNECYATKPEWNEEIHEIQ